MEISKEDQDRIDKDAAQYSANFDSYKAEQAEDDFFEGAIHEHLTQVLPLRKQIEEKDAKLRGYEFEVAALERDAKVKDHNERLREQINEVLEYLELRESVEPEKIQTAERTIITVIKTALLGLNRLK